MTQSELLLIEKLIEKSVETRVMAEISNIKKEYAKELTEVRKAVAKIIKEGYSNNKNTGKQIKENFIKQSERNHGIEDQPDFKQIRQNAYTQNEEDGIYFKNAQTHLPRVSPQTGLGMVIEGNIPDFDAPIMFDQNSSIMKDLMDKIDN